MHSAVRLRLARRRLDCGSRSGGLLQRAGEFPAVRDHEFPVSPDAERCYRGDFSFLRRHLPFWAAIWAQRFAFFAIPVLAIGLPLVPVLPAIYRWRVRQLIASQGQK